MHLASTNKDILVANQTYGLVFLSVLLDPFSSFLNSAENFECQRTLLEEKDSSILPTGPVDLYTSMILSRVEKKDEDKLYFWF